MDEITPVKRNGRPKGSTGRRSELAREIMREMKFDPLRKAIALIKRRKNPISIESQVKLLTAMLPIAHPRLSAVWMNSKQEVDVHVTQLQQMAFADPELAAAMERVSLAASAAAQKARLSDRSGDVLMPAPNVIDVTPETSA